jgi:probable HAF family extracellular repeat protein
VLHAYRVVLLGRASGRNQIVGSSDNASGDPRAVIWANDVITELGTLGGPASTGYAINDLGQVTGTSETASGAVGVFLYSGGTVTDLGTFGTSTIPEAINNHFVVYATIGGRKQRIRLG